MILKYQILKIFHIYFVYQDSKHLKTRTDLTYQIITKNHINVLIITNILMKNFRLPLFSWVILIIYLKSFNL